MFCEKCGAQLPDDAQFCYRCGTPVKQANTQSTQSPQSQQPNGAQSQQQILAPVGVAELKCPSCGAPIKPKLGEMVVTCEYCGSSVTLIGEGWKSIKKHTMLPLVIADEESVLSKVHELMDRGLLHRHLQESSKLEEANLAYVPYWIIPTSARTNIIATDTAVEVGSVATTAALFGVMGGGWGRRGPGFGGGMLEGAMLGGMMAGGMGGMGMGGGARKAYQLDQNYEYPVVALKDLTEYQPKSYVFNMAARVLFDSSKTKGLKVLNGDISEDVAKTQAKTYVDQLQAQTAHSKYHMIQSIQTQVDVSDGELMHVPVWFIRYSHKNDEIVLVLDANTGGIINSIGLNL
ncbi:MAG: zinc ribbon domain-containing protein [Thermoprotei archaeon]